MASVGNESGRGKTNNVELNLVPFIDLLSALVLFLLVTAVWTQISVIPTTLEGASKLAPIASTAESKRLEVRVTAQGYELTWPPNVTLPKSIPLKESHYDKETLLNTMISANVSKDVTEAAISGEENVDYGAVIETIDTVKAGGLGSVALKTN